MISEFPDPATHPSLSQEEMAHALDLLLRPEIAEEGKGRFLTELQRRGETAAELAGFAEILLDAGVMP